MVFIPRISLKTGINPSLLRSFPTDGNYSGTQKLLLAKTRIFGSKIGGNYRSGMQPFWTMKYPKNIFDGNRIDFQNIHKFFPSYKDQNEQEYVRLRKQRLAQTKAKKQSKKKK